MGRHDKAEGLGQRACRVAHQQRVGDMVPDRHLRCLQLIWWRSRSSANLIRDLIVPSGRPVSAAISRVRQIAEVGALDQRALFLGQLCQRLAQATAFLLHFQRLGLVGFGLGTPGQVLGFGPARLAQGVDPAVAGDGEDPGRHARPRRVEQVSLLPKRCHHVLRTFLGQGIASPGFPQESLHPRGKMPEQLREGSRVGIVAHCQKQCGPVGFRIRRHRPSFPDTPNGRSGGRSIVRRKAARIRFLRGQHIECHARFTRVVPIWITFPTPRRFVSRRSCLLIRFRQAFVDKGQNKTEGTEPQCHSKDFPQHPAVSP